MEALLPYAIGLNAALCVVNVIALVGAIRMRRRMTNIPSNCQWVGGVSPADAPARDIRRTGWIGATPERPRDVPAGEVIVYGRAKIGDQVVVGRRVSDPRKDA